MFWSTRKFTFITTFDRFLLYFHFNRVLVKDLVNCRQQLWWCRRINSFRSAIFNVSFAVLSLWYTHSGSDGLLCYFTRSSMAFAMSCSSLNVLLRKQLQLYWIVTYWQYHGNNKRHVLWEANEMTRKKQLIFNVEK